MCEPTKMLEKHLESSGQLQSIGLLLPSLVLLLSDHTMFYLLYNSIGHEETLSPTVW